jgi:hypothetical protein
MSDYKPGSFDPRAYAEEASKGDPASRLHVGTVADRAPPPRLGPPASG